MASVNDAPPKQSKLAAFLASGRSSSPEERKLVRKLDVTLLPVMCLLYWSNYLNRTNYQYAYVSGMRQDLGFTGDQYTTGISLFTTAYTIGQIPHSYLVTKLPARWYFPSMALTWGVLGCCLSATTTVGQVYAIRFLIALCEAATFSGSHYLLSSWYTRQELGKRASLFASSAQLGSLFSGVLQGAIYDNLNGNLGRAGWRWTYIIDGVVALAIALIGFAIMPSTPQMGANWLFTEKERQLAISRMPPREKGDWSLRNILRIVSGYRYLGFCILFMIGGNLEAYGTNGIMPLFLASLNKYPTSKLSYYSLGLTSVGIATTWCAGIATDIWGRRWLANVPMCLGMLISASIILAWDVSLGALLFAFYLGGIAYIQQGTEFPWAAEASRSATEASIILFSMNMWSNAWTAWWSIAIWPNTTAPRFQRGMISTIVLAVFVLAWTFGLRYVELRDRHKQRQEAIPVIATATAADARPESASDEHKDVEATVIKDPKDAF